MSQFLGLQFKRVTGIHARPLGMTGHKRMGVILMLASLSNDGTMVRGFFVDVHG